MAYVHQIVKLAVAPHHALPASRATFCLPVTAMHALLVVQLAVAPRFALTAPLVTLCPTVLAKKVLCTRHYVLGSTLWVPVNHSHLANMIVARIRT